jgi:putative solute:sodium symporter small subunit
MFDLNRQSHWADAKNQLLAMLASWLFFSFVVTWFVKGLNKIVIPYLGFPLGFFMAAQGALIAFVILLFWFAKRMEPIGDDGLPASK